MLYIRHQTDKKTEYQEISASSLTVFKFSTTLEGKALKIWHLQWCRQAHWQMGNYFPSTKLEQLVHCSHYWILVVTCSLYLVFHKFHMYYPKYCAFLQKIKPDNQICITAKRTAQCQSILKPNNCITSNRNLRL